MQCDISAVQNNAKFHGHYRSCVKYVNTKSRNIFKVHEVTEIRSKAYQAVSRYEYLLAGTQFMRHI